MSSKVVSVTKSRSEGCRCSTQAEVRGVPGGRFRLNGRAISVILIILALAYGFLAGFHTILDLALEAVINFVCLF